VFEPKLFLNLAEELKDSPKDNLLESRVRASIGRSYYSIFLATRAKIEGLINKDLEKATDVYQRLIAALKSSSDNNVAEFGSHLDSLRKYRNQADYKTRTNLTNPSLANDAFNLAENLFENLKTLPDSALKFSL
jgi:uncharacterized protein (UPF0332 family)